VTYVVVAYDISDDRSRLWVSEKLKSHGLVRIQRSWSNVLIETRYLVI